MAMRRGKRFSLPVSWYYYPNGSAILQVYFDGKWMDTTIRKHPRKSKKPTWRGRVHPGKFGHTGEL